MRSTAVYEGILGDVINDAVESWIVDQAHEAGRPLYVMAYKRPRIIVRGEHTADFEAEAVHGGEDLVVTGFITGSDIVCVKAVNEDGVTVYPTPRKALIRR